MTELRCQVITRRASDLAIDHVTNTLYFDTDTPFSFALDNVNETQLAIDLRNVFRARQFHGSGYGVEVKIYDMADAMPRPVRGHALWAETTGAFSGAVAPREVALCLSFRGATNTARTRGRLFIGPFQVSQMQERPSQGLRENLGILATAIGNVGGIDIDWCVRSSFGNAMIPIKHAWVDDEWDTVRSRGVKPTVRSVTTLDE